MKTSRKHKKKIHKKPKLFSITGSTHQFCRIVAVHTRTRTRETRARAHVLPNNASSARLHSLICLRQSGIAGRKLQMPDLRQIVTPGRARSPIRARWAHVSFCYSATRAKRQWYLGQTGTLCHFPKVIQVNGKAISAERKLVSSRNLGGLSLASPRTPCLEVFIVLLCFAHRDAKKRALHLTAERS